MDGLLLGFAVFFVLAVACACALGVVRMLIKNSPAARPWPHIHERIQARTRRGRFLHRTRPTA